MAQEGTQKDSDANTSNAQTVTDLLFGIKPKNEQASFFDEKPFLFRFLSVLSISNFYEISVDIRNVIYLEHTHNC